mmetsp:Transcript_16622/g.21099  ORF Transcript_16622/g.21099 Transcript_16622/m.21099 type:complete len:97 (+) Transcript_16622:1-291(+)
MPSSEPSSLPTLSSSFSPSVKECYSLNHKDCVPYTYVPSEDSCLDNHILLPFGALKNCIALGSNCVSYVSEGCCGDLFCLKSQDLSYGVCVPISTE